MHTHSDTGAHAHTFTATIDELGTSPLCRSSSPNPCPPRVRTPTSPGCALRPESASASRRPPRTTYVTFVAARSLSSLRPRGLSIWPYPSDTRMAHHWPAAILAERHGEHIRRIPTRVSSEGRGSPRASPASRTTAMATASAHAAADGSPGTRVAARLRGHVSIRRHWLSDACTQTNAHTGRRDESTSQRRSPDRGRDAPYTPLLKRRSSGSGAMGSACGGRRS